MPNPPAPTGRLCGGMALNDSLMMVTVDRHNFEQKNWARGPLCAAASKTRSEVFIYDDCPNRILR
jgi:hypothetical protein